MDIATVAEVSYNFLFVLINFFDLLHLLITETCNILDPSHLSSVFLLTPSASEIILVVDGEGISGVQHSSRKL